MTLIEVEDEAEGYLLWEKIYGLISTVASWSVCWDCAVLLAHKANCGKVPLCGAAISSFSVTVIRSMFDWICPS